MLVAKGTGVVIQHIFYTRQLPEEGGREEGGREGGGGKGGRREGREIQHLM